MSTIVEGAEPSSASCGESISRYNKGEMVYFQGDAATAWFVVLSGIVRTCRFGAEGRRQLTGFFYERDVFGVDAPVYAACAEAVVASRIGRHGGGHGPFGARGADPLPPPDALAAALGHAQDHIILLGHRGAAERLAAFLIAISARFDAAGGTLLPMSRIDIADYLGLTIETVSRAISDFARRKLIALDTPQHLRILDRAGLGSVSGDAGQRQSDENAALVATARTRAMVPTGLQAAA